MIALNNTLDSLSDQTPPGIVVGLVDTNGKQRFYAISQDKLHLVQTALRDAGAIQVANP